jgi:NitT/TauT family transport system permease protein
MKNHTKLFLRGFLIFHVIWWIGARLLKTQALPSPEKVYKNLPRVLNGSFRWHVLSSLYRLGAGLFWAILIGSGIGILMGRHTKINQLLNPLLYFTYPIPKTALLPVVMILCGLGDGSKILLITLITIFPIIVSVRDACLHIESSYYHTLLSLGAGKWQMLWYVTLPGILPDLVTSVRLSVGTALSILFFAENYGTSLGIGYFIQDSWMRIDYLSMYGGILLLSLIGLLLFVGLDQLEQHVCKGKA